VIPPGPAPEIWVEAPHDGRWDGAAGPGALGPLLHVPVTGLLVEPGRPWAGDLPARWARGWRLAAEDDAAPGPEARDLVVTSDPRVLRRARARGHRVGLLAAIRDETTMLEACRALEAVDYVFVALADPTNIPLELLLARAQSTGTRIIKRVATGDEARVALGVLEHGCQGVLVAGDDPAAAGRLARALGEARLEPLALCEARITRVLPVGMGYRACVDTTSLLGPAEGMVVGSTSAGGLLACAEVHDLPYMNTRPFRVNAGAVHSYVWGPRDAVVYLTDLGAGAEVLAIGTGGAARTVAVGRVKIEVRPLLLVEAAVDGRTVNLIAQDDWHVRVFGAGGEPRNITTLRPGEGVLAHVCEPGRHVGIKVSETIVER
jgi:3-dehydroquinate synthase II/3-amino-4-hydroxybenzoic acid synthase